MKKISFLLIGMIFFAINLHAQSSSEIKPLNIGDTVPDVALNQVMNYALKATNLYHFLKNKKLIILDFWSTSCSACIGYFPHMQALSDKFRDDLQIILVDGNTKVWHDNETKIKRVLVNLEKTSGVNIRLPIVLNCDILDKYFPRRTIPHEVWINNMGKVIAITGAAEVNEKNIEALLHGEKVSMHMKEDVFFDIQSHPLSELIYGENRLSGTPVSSSVLYKGLIDGLGNLMGFRTDGSDSLFTGWSFTNMSLLFIYKLVYPNRLSYPDNRIIVLSKDSAQFDEVNFFDTAKYTRSYSYDLTVPPVPMNELREYAQQDLERTFHLKISDEKREVNCLILKTTPRLKNSIAKGGEKKYMMDRSDNPKYIRNFPISELVKELNLKYFKIPLIDETGINKEINMDMPDTLTENNIIHALIKAGFEVTKEKREVEVAVIKDK